MMKKFPLQFWQFLGVCLLIVWQIGEMNSNPAHAQFIPTNAYATVNNACGQTFYLQSNTYYNVATGVGTASLPTCTPPTAGGGAVAAITSGTIDGVTIGGVTPVSLVINGALISGGAAVSNGQEVWSVGSNLAGTAAGSPYMQVGTGSGLSQGIICGTVSTGLSGCWGTGSTLASNNYALSVNSNNTNTSINATSTVQLQASTITVASVNSTSLNVLSGGSTNTFTVTASTGAVSPGSLVSNSNGIEGLQTTVGAVSSAAVV
jgi:hypothetical protein